MRSLGFTMLATTWLAFALSLACEPQASPADGTLVGNFAITATLQSNGCAPAYNPTSPTSFQARLYASGTTSTWATNGASVTGTANGNTIHVTATSSMTPFTNCVIDQTETIDATYTTTPTDSGTPDAGTHSATISGTDTITRSTQSGNLCDAILLLNGGSYPTLPCTATFAFTGTSN